MPPPGALAAGKRVALAVAMLVAVLGTAPLAGAANSASLASGQVDRSQEVVPFHRRKNIGLHHLALEVESEAKLHELHQKVSAYPGAKVEFAPELLGAGPRKHMMCNEPGGIRIEFIWQGA